MWSSSGSLTTTPSTIYLPNGWKEIKVDVDAGCYGRTGSSYTAPSVAAVNGVTTIYSYGTPTAGTFVIRVFPAYGDVFTTSALTFDESAADVKTALIAGSTVFVTGDITAAGGALPTDITLTWTGAYAGTVPPIDVVSSVTPGEIIARTTTQAAGNGGYGYIDSVEVWSSDRDGITQDRYLYLATVSGVGTYQVTAYR